MNNPLVSVIIPNYCHAQFLDERIQSVLQQTFQHFEVIILDDHSLDNGASREVIEQYRHEPHVSHIVYNEVNSGSAFRQWHKGLELARGKYVWIAESDDSCDKTLLEKLTNIVVQHGAVIAFCRSVMYNANGVKSHYEWQDVLAEDFVVDGKYFITNYLVNRNCIANASSVLFRRVDALCIDQQYMQMKAEGDWMFWILLAECGSVCFINETLNYFRQHAENTTKKSISSGVAAKEHIEVYKHLVVNGLLSGYSKYRERKNSAFFALSLSLDKETTRTLMQYWDPYYIFRVLFFFKRIQKKGRKLFCNMNALNDAENVASL